MLDTILFYIAQSMPYVFLGIGVVGIFLLFARITVKYVAPAARA